MISKLFWHYLCTHALSLNEKIHNSLYFRGLAYFKLGNKTKACEDWTKSGEQGKAEAYEMIKKILPINIQSILKSNNYELK